MDLFKKSLNKIGFYKHPFFTDLSVNYCEPKTKEYLQLYMDAYGQYLVERFQKKLLLI